MALGDGSLPVGVAANGVGNLYVADTNNNRLQMFTIYGIYQGQWGTPGSAAGQFLGPHEITIDGSGILYVADRLNNRIQMFNSLGGYLAQWGSQGNAQNACGGRAGEALQREIKRERKRRQDQLTEEQHQQGEAPRA